MAKPFFSGNYGSALARVDTRPIMEAGKAQGQSFQAIGGMIKEYGLNKEKRQKEEDAAMGSLMGLNPEALSQLKSRNPKIEGAVDKLINGTGGKREVDLINSSVAPFIAGQARADKEEDRKIATQQSLINQKLLEQELATKSDLQAAAKENQDFKNLEKQRSEKFYKTVENNLNDLTVAIASGRKSFDKLSHWEKFALGNANGIRNRAIPKEDLFYDPSVDLDNAKAKLEFESLKRQEKDAKVESDRLPEFADKTSALASVKDRDPGVSAKIVPFKGGFNVSMQVSAKDFPTSVQPLEGFKDVYSHKGYLYKGIKDKNGKMTMTKIGSEQIGQRSDLLGKAIDRLDDQTLGNYRVAKRDGKLNDDNDYEFTYRDPVTREEEEMTKPFNPILEGRLEYVDELISKYQTTLDEEIDLDLTTIR